MFIQVKPRTTLKFKHLDLRKDTLQSFTLSGQFESRLKGYRTKDGLIVTTYKNEVIQLNYIANPGDVSSSCYNYYQDSQAFVQTLGIHPPVSLTIMCAPEHPKAGEQIILTAFASIETRRGYTWTVNLGKIVSGQQTHQIVVDTTGLPGVDVLVTAEIEDALGHAAMVSYRVPLRP